MIAVTVVAVFAIAEGPGFAVLVARVDQRVHGLRRGRIAAPAFGVQQAGGDDDLIEDVPMRLVVVRAEMLGVLAREQVEKHGRGGGLGGSKVANGVQVLADAGSVGRIAEIAAYEKSHLRGGSGHAVTDTITLAAVR